VPFQCNHSRSAFSELLHLALVEEGEDQRLKVGFLSKALAEKVEEQRDVCGVGVLLQRFIEYDDAGMESVQRRGRRRQRQRVRSDEPRWVAAGSKRSKVAGDQDTVRIVLDPFGACPPRDLRRHCGPARAGIAQARC
jgi:hypothetical protein